MPSYATSSDAIRNIAELAILPLSQCRKEWGRNLLTESVETRPKGPEYSPPARSLIRSYRYYAGLLEGCHPKMTLHSRPSDDCR